MAIVSGAPESRRTYFFQRYELKHNQPEGLLIHQTGLVQGDGKDMVMLDLDFISTAVQELTNRKRVEAWLEQAHERVEEAFLDSLGPEVYRLLKEGAQ